MTLATPFKNQFYSAPSLIRNKLVQNFNIIWIAQEKSSASGTEFARISLAADTGLHWMKKKRKITRSNRRHHLALLLPRRRQVLLYLSLLPGVTGRQANRSRTHQMAD